PGSRNGAANVVRAFRQVAARTATGASGLPARLDGRMPCSRGLGGAGARGLERLVVFVALGAAAIPAWMTIDRGNSVGFVVPIALVFLVALCRRRWGLVAIMVVLAALVKPQFAVLAVALFAARQWRLGGLAVAGGVISNLAAYLLWPRAFPKTI